MPGKYSLPVHGPTWQTTFEMDRSLKLAMIDKELGLPPKLSDYSYEDAIRLTLAAIHVKDADFLHFNLACFYSALGRIDESLSELDEALKKGYNKWDAISVEPSLYNVTRTDKFWELISRYIPRAAT